MGKDVETTIGYWRDPGDGSSPSPDSYDTYKELLLGHRDEDLRQTLVRDIRGNEMDYSLDTQGFQVHKLPVKYRDISDQQVVETEYYKEISDLIKEITGARQVTIFGQIMRAYKRDALAAVDFIPGKIQGPSPRAHTDVSHSDPLGFASLVPGASELIEQTDRWQLLGIWRPVKPVLRDPLAFTDSRSVPDSDYRDLKGPKYTPSLLRVGGKSEHRWHYCSDMTPDEVVIIKHFDSKTDIPAYRCAHTSIVIPGTEELPARESIEVRALVCF